MSKNADQKVTLILKLEVEGKGVIHRGKPIFLGFPFLF